jgi:hypothetical protein
VYKHSEPYLLSKQGSDRATAYDFANKAVTRNGKTHVVWTDAVALTRGRTFDHAAGEWGAMDAHDRRQNDRALITRGRLLSVHTTHAGQPFWIITDPGWRDTTLLLPEDY